MFSFIKNYFVKNISVQIMEGNIDAVKKYVNTVQNQVNVLDEYVLSEYLNNQTKNKEKDKVDKK